MNRKGFTLIELMVVISIIAILLSVGIVTFSKAQLAGRDGKRKQDLRSIKQALELYNQQNHSYPPSGSDWCDQLSDSKFPQVKNDLANYLANIPSDPSYNGTDKDYYYFYVASSNSYGLFAVLENSSDSDAQPNVLVNFDGGAVTGCSGHGHAFSYNYAIFSGD